MKKHLVIFTIFSLLLALSGCDSDDRSKMTDNYPTDYDIHYGLRQVMQYDPMNINGINIIDKFDFFETLRLTIHYTNSEISAVTFTKGEIPFSTFGFALPTGKVDVFLDKSVSPNAITIKGTDNVIATIVNAEVSIIFQLDNPYLQYKYTFKSVE